MYGELETTQFLRGAAQRVRVGSVRMLSRLAGARSRWVSTRRGDLHALELEGRGSLPPVVLLHGLGATALDWAPLVAGIRNHVSRIIAFDLPGHGVTPAPAGGMRIAHLVDAVAQAMPRLFDRPAAIVGNSLGGLVGIRTALAAPSLAHSLVLVSPAGAPTPARERERHRARMNVSSLREAIAFVRDVIAHPRWYHDLLALGVRSRLQRPAVTELLQRAGDGDTLMPAELAALRPPTLLVWGAQERILPAHHRDFFRRHLPPHAVVTTPEGYGHAPFLDQPRDLARRIVEFVGGSVVDDGHG